MSIVALSEEHFLLQAPVAKFADRELMPLEPAIPERVATEGEVCAGGAAPRQLSRAHVGPRRARGNEGITLPTVVFITAEQEGSRTVVPFELPPNLPNPHMLMAVANKYQRERKLNPDAAGCTN